MIFSLTSYFLNETAKFFGVPSPVTTESNGVSFLELSEEEKWQRRRFRHLKKFYSIKKNEVIDELKKGKKI